MYPRGPGSGQNLSFSPEITPPKAVARSTGMRRWTDFGAALTQR